MANVIKHKRGSGSDPVASDLVVGEVAIRTDVGKLFTKMDNGSVAEIAGGGSDIAINTLSSSSATGGGSATFNGSAYRFTLSAPPSVSAQQLLVSINGVIQKPVAGTGQPSEGFSVDGTDIILGDAPATGSDFFILTFKSLGVSEPADNSVTSAKIADGAIVNADINASAAIAGTKINPSFTSDITISNSAPSIALIDTDSNSDFSIFGSQGEFRIRDQSNTTNRLTIASDGTTTIAGNTDFGAGIDVTGAITGTGDMTIDTNTLHVDSSNNRVGIGTTSPNRHLHLHESDSTGAVVRFTNTTTGSGENDGLTVGINGSEQAEFWQRENTAMVFGTNNTQRMAISASGNVGIGAASPDTKLHLEASNNGVTAMTSANNRLRFTDTDTTVTSNQPTGVIEFESRDSGNEGIQAYIACKGSNTGQGSLHFATGKEASNTLAERMTIDQSGNVGIGITPDSHGGTVKSLQIGTATNLYNETSDDYTILGNNVYFDGSNNKYIKTQESSRLLQNAGEFTFQQAVSGSADANISYTTPLKIDSSGNVGIGTTSPSQKLQVTSGNILLDGTDQFIYLSNDADQWLSANAASNYLRIGTGNAERVRIDSSGRMFLGLSSSSFPKKLNIQGSSGSIIALKNHDTTSYAADTNTSIEFGLNTGNTGNQNGACELRAFKENGTNGNNARGLSFYTGANGGSNQERMRITSAGEIFTGGQTAITSTGHHIGEATTGNSFIRIGHDNTGANYSFMMFRHDGSDIGTIQQNSGGTAVSYNTSSDYRLKENATAISDGITRLKTLKPYRFNFKIDPDNTVDGFFAHEVTAVPEAITGTKDEVDSDNNPVYQGIDQSKLVPLLVAAVQELTAKVEALEAK